MRRRRRRIRAFLERAILGSLMSVAAFVIERRVLKAIKQKGEAREGAPVVGSDEEIDIGT